MSDGTNLFSLSGEIALVTGATRGIGAEIAAQFRAAGADVIGTATTAAGAAKIADRLGGGDTGKVLDVASDESVQALMKDLAGRLPTILVNNAGIVRDNLLLRMKPDDWRDVVNTNLNSAYRLCKACLRGMLKARRGRIINLSSVVGVAGAAGQANYAAAKAGLLGFTRALALEVAGRGITVKRHRSGLYRNRHDRGRNVRAKGRDRHADSGRTRRFAAGRGRGRRLPGVTRGVLRHRNRAARERWNVDGLNPAGTSPGNARRGGYSVRIRASALLSASPGSQGNWIYEQC